MDRSVTHKILNGHQLNFYPYNILGVISRSLNCHMALSSMNYLLNIYNIGIYFLFQAPCSLEDEEDFISEEEIKQFKANEKNLQVQREELREKLRKQFCSFCTDHQKTPDSSPTLSGKGTRRPCKKWCHMLSWIWFFFFSFIFCDTVYFGWWWLCFMIFFI